jgi:hypothetical protein
MNEPDDFAEEQLDYAIRNLRREGLYEQADAVIALRTEVDAVDALRAENTRLRALLRSWLLHGGTKEVLLEVRKELGMGPPHQ